MKLTGADKGVYINFLGDDELIIFYISKINDKTCKRENKCCKRTTAEYSVYTNKEVYLVPKKIG